MRVIKNPYANPESKTQQKKAEYLKAHPIELIKCEKCGDVHSTLHNVDGKYFCKKHMPKN